MKKLFILISFVVLVGFWAKPANASLSFVQASSSVGAASAGSATTTIVTTAGNLLVAFCDEGNGASALATTTDSAGGIWTLGGYVGAGVTKAGMFYEQNAPSVSSINCSWNVAQTTRLIVYEISGAALTGAADANASNFGAASSSASVISLKSSALTTDNANDIVLFGVRIGGNGAPFSAGTAGYAIPAAASTTQSAMEYAIFSSLQTNTSATINWSVAKGNDVGIIGAFKQAAAPTTATARRRTTMVISDN